MRSLACVRTIVRSSFSSAVSCTSASSSSFPSSLRPLSVCNAPQRAFSMSAAASSFAKKGFQQRFIANNAILTSALLASDLSLPAFLSSYRSFSNVPATNGPHSIVITLAGPDRPGIVRDLSKRLQELNANIEESRMTILGNDFAVILLVNFPTTDVSATAVKDALQQLFPDFLVATRSTAAQRAIFASPHRIFTIHVQGPDQPGIVRNLTELLVTYNISVRDLDTDTSSAPFAGYKIFNLKAVIAVPTSVSFTSLHEGLKLFEEKYGFQVEIDDPTQPQQQSSERDDFAYEDESVDDSEEEPEEEEEDYPEEDEEEQRHQRDKYYQQQKNQQQQALQQQQKKQIPAAQYQQQQQSQQGGKQNQHQQNKQQQHDLNKTYKDTVRAEKDKKQRK